MKTKERVGSIKSNKLNNDLYEYRWYWHIVASNGRIIARSSETYTRKGNAVKSIKVVASIFELPDWHKYYDHSQPNTPLKSYL